jgi:hypothetical protein
MTSKLKRALEAHRAAARALEEMLKALRQGQKAV